MEIAIKSVQDQLLSLNVNEYTDNKNGLTYLSWSHAWEEFIKVCPSATYEIKKNENGLPYFGEDDIGYMVYTSVTVDAITHEMWLPVMDFNNRAMKKKEHKYKQGKYEKTCNAMTMFDVNKAIMRCLTKNLAMFGLGLYIYKGEDLPQEEQKEKDAAEKKADEEKERKFLMSNCKKGIERFEITNETLEKYYGTSNLEKMTLSYLRNLSIDINKKIKKAEG